MGQESGWKTDASQLSAGVKPAAKLCLGPKGPFGNDGVGNTGLLGTPILNVLAPPGIPQAVRDLSCPELLFKLVTVQDFSP